MFLVEVRASGPSDRTFTSFDDFLTYYREIPEFELDEYDAAIEQMKTDGKIVFGVWEFIGPRSVKGVYLLKDQDAYDHYINHPVNDHAKYDPIYAANDMTWEVSHEEV